jgi:hypothetical protein
MPRLLSPRIVPLNGRSFRQACHGLALMARSIMSHIRRKARFDMSRTIASNILRSRAISASATLAATVTDRSGISIVSSRYAPRLILNS